MRHAQRSASRSQRTDGICQRTVVRSQQAHRRVFVALSILLFGVAPDIRINIRTRAAGHRIVGSGIREHHGTHHPGPMPHAAALRHDH